MHVSVEYPLLENIASSDNFINAAAHFEKHYISSYVW